MLGYFNREPIKFFNIINSSQHKFNSLLIRIGNKLYPSLTSQDVYCSVKVVPYFYVVASLFACCTVLMAKLKRKCVYKS